MWKKWNRKSLEEGTHRTCVFHFVTELKNGFILSFTDNRWSLIFPASILNYWLNASNMLFFVRSRWRKMVASIVRNDFRMDLIFLPNRSTLLGIATGVRTRKDFCRQRIHFSVTATVIINWMNHVRVFIDLLFSVREGDPTAQFRRELWGDLDIEWRRDQWIRPVGWVLTAIVRDLEDIVRDRIRSTAFGWRWHTRPDGGRFARNRSIFIPRPQWLRRRRFDYLSKEVAVRVKTLAATVMLATKLLRRQ